MSELRQGQQTSAVYWLVNSEGFKVVFNDPSDPDYVGPISGDQGVSGIDAPDVREAAVNVTEGHGGLHGNFWADRRAFSVQTQITGANAASIDTRESILGAINRASNAYSSDCALIWFPGDPAVVSTTRMNIVADPSFEYDVTGNAPGVVQTSETGYGFLPALPWADGSDSQWTSRVFAAAAHTYAGSQGSKSLHLSGVKDANTTLRTLLATTGTFTGGVLTGTGAGGIGAITPGRVYSAQCVQDLVTATGASGSNIGGRLDIDWYDQNGVYISTVSSNLAPSNTVQVTTLTINGATAPSNAYSAVLSWRLASANTSKTVDAYADSFQFVAEATAGAYLDGDSTNSSWLGLAGFSQSVNRPNGRFIAARRQQPTRISGIGYVKDVLVNLVAADPRIYSTAMHRQQFAHNTAANIENKGNAEAPAIYRVYGPYTGNLTITNVANATTYTLKWDGSLVGAGNTANHYVQADEFFRSVLLDPTGYPGTGTNKYGALDFTTTNWPTILPGPTNTVKFLAGGGTSGSTIMDVRWRDAWM